MALPRLLRAAMIVAIVMFYAAPLRPAQAQSIPELTQQLAEQFARVGLTPSDGITYLVEGIGRAIPGTAAEAAAHGIGARELARVGLEGSRAFLSSVVARLTWLIDNGVITQNSVRQLGHGATWSSRSGAVSLGPFLKGMAVALVAARSYAEGREFTLVTLYELEKAADLAEAEAYAGLLERLVDQTTNGTLVLCDGMGYAEAATRLHINMRTSPGEPYWNILCGSTRGREPARSGGDPLLSSLGIDLPEGAELLGPAERKSTCEIDRIDRNPVYIVVRDRSVCKAPWGPYGGRAKGGYFCAWCPPSTYWRSGIGCCHDK